MQGGGVQRSEYLFSITARQYCQMTGRQANNESRGLLYSINALKKCLNCLVNAQPIIIIRFLHFTNVELYLYLARTFNQ